MLQISYFWKAVYMLGNMYVLGCLAADISVLLEFLFLSLNELLVE